MYLVAKNNADFIALGEISDSDFNYLNEKISKTGLTLKSGVTSAGRAKYDTCYIYNPDTFTFINIEDISDKSSGRTLKVAQRINLVENHSGRPIVILASHWPSRLNMGEQHPNRDVLGIRLRDAARGIKLADNSSPHIILLGDYNDEPFSRSLSDQLMASRDRAHVKRKENLFYNPFWSYLGWREKDESHPLGSYYWTNGLTTRWLTLDQIIFSASFISGDDWKLSDSGGALVDYPELTALVQNRKSKFDHIPVCATIEKEIIL